MTAIVPVGVSQRAGEVAGRRRVERVAPQEVAGLRPVQQSDLVALGREDLVEDGHGALSLRSAA